MATGRGRAHPGLCRRRGRRWRRRAGAVVAAVSIFALRGDGEAETATLAPSSLGSVFRLLLAPRSFSPSLYEHEGSLPSRLATGALLLHHFLFYLLLFLFLFSSVSLFFLSVLSG